jgi:hypothetical protein
MTDRPGFEETPKGTPSELPNSTTAIISLVAGILGLTFFPLMGSVVALITGSMATKEILQSGGTVGGESMARIGILLGWIGIGLAVLGICIAGVFLVIPLCIVALGLSSGEWGMVLPIVSAFI